MPTPIHTLTIWITALDQYTFTQLVTRPSPESWSLGQLYKHLIADTTYYLEQVKICITNNDHAGEDASPHGRVMLANNAFPDERIEGDPSNAFITQPGSKEELMQSMLHLKSEISKLSISVAESPFHGKTKHPGLNYFNAAEWLQFADMHFRHHLRQKGRIEEFLRRVT